MKTSETPITDAEVLRTNSLTNQGQIGCLIHLCKKKELELNGFCKELGRENGEVILAMVRLQEMKRELNEAKQKLSGHELGAAMMAETIDKLRVENQALRLQVSRLSDGTALTRQIERIQGERDKARAELEKCPKSPCYEC